jgi:hypothetical protein
MPDLSRLVSTITDIIGTWDTPFVELAIFETGDPVRIAEAVNAFCIAHLASTIAGILFYESSQGAVFGLLLDDGRRVVIKASQPDRPLAFLRNVYSVQRCLARHGYPCPRPLLGPAPLGRGYALVEELVDSGSYVDAHAPSIRRVMAELLYWHIELARAFTSLPGWQPDMFNAAAHGGLWPKPHSRIFNFEATAERSAWIDRYAARARQQYLEYQAGTNVIGHTDWSVKHFRFIDGQISVIYDWDSLALDKEPVIVGSAARGFTMTWHLDVPVAPTLDEARAFVAEYEAARGKSFTKAERASLAAAATYAIAYSARCQNCLIQAGKEYPAGSYLDLLARDGEAFLRL